MTTVDPVVQPEGLAGNEEDRRLAVRDVWYIPGLSGVEERLQTPQLAAER